jgi:DNA polymerase III psi subunit
LNPGKEFFKNFYPEDIYRVNDRSTEDGSSSLEEPENGTVIALNGNKRSETLLLFNFGGSDLPAGSDGELLEKILEAVGLKTEDTGWINLGNYPGISWKEIALASNANKIIAFGINKNQLPAGLKEGQIYHFNSRKCIASRTLTELDQDKNAKFQLWQLLKELYVRG